MEPVITARNLQKTFDNGVKAVQGLDIEIFEGEVFGFLGPNGAGKSTSINMFTGIMKPTDGKLQIMDLEIPKDISKLPNYIGYVPQNLVFYDHLTVYENLMLFARAYKISNPSKRVEELISLLQLDEIRNRQAQHMSGGQKRRLNLAIGLLHSPKILFLDEPSAGMDPQSRNVLWKTVETLAQNDGITIILTTHLMETADRLADRIAIIDKGVIQIIDTPENLKKQYGKGDVIELEINKELDESELNSLGAALNKEWPDFVFQTNHSFKISVGNGVTSISKILDTVDSTIGRINLSQLSMRENTLEDVFITITGSKLREGGKNHE